MTPEIFIISISIGAFAAGLFCGLLFGELLK